MNYVRKLDDNEYVKIKRSLDVYGYAKVDQYIAEEHKGMLLDIVERQYSLINASGRFEYQGAPNRDRGDKIIYNLQNIDIAFIDLLTTPTVRRICIDKLNDEHYRYLPNDVPNYTLLFYNARSSGGKLDLHIDSHIPFSGDRTFMLQVVYLLQDSTISNGCTTVVPGSHKSGRFTDRELEDLTPLTGRAGDVLIWDSRIWHGTYPNHADVSRWALVATLGMWWIKPSLDIVRSLGEDMYSKCTDEQKQILGFCSIPPLDPYERINTKSGYESLKSNYGDYLAHG